MNFLLQLAEYPALFIIFTFAVISVIVLLTITFSRVSISTKGIVFTKSIAKQVDRFWLAQNITEKRRGRIYFIKYKGTIAEQMKFAEMNLADVERKIDRTFEKHLIETNTPLEQLVIAKDRWDKLKVIAVAALKDEIRRSFWENHFLEKSKVEFEVYKQKQNEKFYDIAFTNLEYMKQLDYYIKWDELKDKFFTEAPYFKSIFSTVYEGAKDISRKYLDEMRCLEESNTKTFQEFLSGNPISQETDVNICFD